MTRGRVLLSALALLLGAFAAPASAHFGVVLPSSDMVLEKGESPVRATFAFAHPMEAEGMDLERPKAVRVVSKGSSVDLLPALEPAEVFGRAAWTASVPADRPGVRQIVMEPAPYWEPAEDRFIVHLTKAYVASFGVEEGWDEPAGLKFEIVPLARPFGNYAGCLFRGVVLLDGRPVPDCPVEIERWNADGAFEAPNGYMTTLAVRTDANGVFAFCVPFEGWWGFAALKDSEERIEFEGRPRDVEMGAVLWSRFLAPVRKGEAE